MTSRYICSFAIMKMFREIRKTGLCERAWHVLSTQKQLKQMHAKSNTQPAHAHRYVGVFNHSSWSWPKLGGSWHPALFSKLTKLGTRARPLGHFISDLYGAPVPKKSKICLGFNATKRHVLHREQSSDRYFESWSLVCQVCVSRERKVRQPLSKKTQKGSQGVIFSTECKWRNC